METESPSSENHDSRACVRDGMSNIYTSMTTFSTPSPSSPRRTQSSFSPSRPRRSEIKSATSDNSGVSVRFSIAPRAGSGIRSFSASELSPTTVDDTHSEEVDFDEVDDESLHRREFTGVPGFYYTHYDSNYNSSEEELENSESSIDMRLPVELEIEDIVTENGVVTEDDNAGDYNTNEDEVDDTRIVHPVINMNEYVYRTRTTESKQHEVLVPVYYDGLSASTFPHTNFLAPISAVVKSKPRPHFATVVETNVESIVSTSPRILVDYKDRPPTIHRSFRKCSPAVSRTLLALFTFCPPLWLVMSFGGLDSAIGTVPVREKRIALVLGTGLFIASITGFIIGFTL
ncbi:hypothetical protein V1512DRAFT_258148 [Lipomyces arxii]|uniref:uncharacterized protein n=1 Tax=Lipomyces arxii TaxID=56418 RepID=UPI0034CFE58E